ncbi:MAG: M20/M25/M40 family metallo-hydrolase [Actinobacteria bacterium]|nr:M20/M25/M40 family metallo-hydrolase [Actinomycetota bacterium]
MSEANGPAVPAEVREAVAAAAAAREEDLLEVAEALIRVNSTNASYLSPDDEGQGGESRAAEVLGERCAELGMRVERVGPEPTRQNVVAIAAGAGGGRSLLMNGHIDTVPASDPSAWTQADPRVPERHDGVLFGLGAADMKGPVAAGWAALAAIRDAGVELAGEVQLHGVVGEEAMEHELGTSGALASFRADAAINLEPTGLILTSASLGYRSLTMRVTGRSTHHGNRSLSMRPGGDAVGVNALEKAVLVVQGMQELERRWAAEELHPWFPPGSFTLHPGTFTSIGAPDLPAPVFFPAEAILEYGIWYPPSWSGKEVEERVEAFLAEWLAGDTWLAGHPVEFTWGYDWPPFETAREEPIVGTVAAAIEAVQGSPVPPPSPQSPASVGASVDSTWIELAGIPVVTFGPGEMAVAHSPDERVAISELVTAAQVLALAIVEWCGVVA